MRTEKELIQEIRDTNVYYDGLDVTEEELNIIGESDIVKTFEYVGLRDGGGGPYTYHVTLIDDDGVKSLYYED